MDKIYWVLVIVVVIGCALWWWKKMPPTVNSVSTSPGAGTPHVPPSSVPPGSRPDPSDVGGNK